MEADTRNISEQRKGMISILTDMMYYKCIIQDKRNYIEIQENYRKNIGIQEE